MVSSTCTGRETWTSQDDEDDANTCVIPRVQKSVLGGEKAPKIAVHSVFPGTKRIVRKGLLAGYNRY
jgi:hypothetical protein